MYVVYGFDGHFTAKSKISLCLFFLFCDPEKWLVSRLKGKCLMRGEAKDRREKTDV